MAAKTSGLGTTKRECGCVLTLIAIHFSASRYADQTVLVRIDSTSCSASHLGGTMYVAQSILKSSASSGPRLASAVRLLNSLQLMTESEWHQRSQRQSPSPSARSNRNPLQTLTSWLSRLRESFGLTPTAARSSHPWWSAPSAQSVWSAVVGLASATKVRCFVSDSVSPRSIPEDTNTPTKASSGPDMAT